MTTNNFDLFDPKFHVQNLKMIRIFRNGEKPDWKRFKSPPVLPEVHLEFTVADNLCLLLWEATCLVNQETGMSFPV